MIELRDLTKGFWVRDSYVTIFDGLNLVVPAGRSVALLGGNGSGKSTLLKLIAGTLRPDRGAVLSDGTISWPVGQAGSFHRDLTGAQNTRFVARVYGVDSDELEAFVAAFADIGEHFHMPIRTYSSGMRSRLTFGIAMGIPFDTYLVDEVTAVGDARFKRKSKALFRARLASASAIMVSHSLNELKDFCNAGMILHKGRLSYFDDLDEAIVRHKAMMAV